MTDVVSAQLRRSMDALGAFADWATDPELFEALDEPTVCDFVFGNPHDTASAEYVDAIVRAAQPTGPRHYAYTQNDPVATEAIASGLRDRFAMPFAAEDVYLTNGNFTGLSLLLRALTDPGDEVVFISPPWFFYESLIVGAMCTPVRVYADRTTFDLDLDAIAACHHVEDPRHHHQLAQQSERPDLSAGIVGGPRPPPHRGERAQRPPRLDALRRGVQPDRVRRSSVHDPDRVLPALLPRLHVREDPAGARIPARLRGRSPVHARAGGAPRPSARCPDHLRMGLPDLDPAVRDPGARDDRVRPLRAATPPRPDRVVVGCSGLRADRAGGDLLRDGAVTAGRRCRVLQAAQRARRVRAPGGHVRDTRLVPDPRSRRTTTWSNGGSRGSRQPSPRLARDGSELRVPRVRRVHGLAR